MAHDFPSSESASTASEFSGDDYCGTTYAAKLLGLSVATVQSLVEKGEIEAWKTAGGHRRLSLRAISNYRQKSSPHAVQIDPDPRNRLSVMVVEDDEATRELYKAHFEQWDLPVDCSFMPSALEALMDIAGLRPDLLITDLNMPGIDGLEMLRTVKRNLQLSSMQVLVISGLPKEAIKDRGGLPANSHYHEKPIKFDWVHGYVTALAGVVRKRR